MFRAGVSKIRRQFRLWTPNLLDIVCKWSLPHKMYAVIMASPGRKRLATSCGVSMEWTAERVELLKELWGEGLSARQIAESLGHVTRNAVIGKTHRLGLSTRSVPSKPAIAMLNPVTDRLCQWPIGNPGELEFHFCGQQSEAGRPYCEQHCSMAYRQSGSPSAA